MSVYRGAIFVETLQKSLRIRMQICYNFNNQFWVALLRIGTPIPFLPPSHRSRGINGLGLDKSTVKIKEEIKKSGVFWLPSFSGSVPGVLSISNEAGIVLEVATSPINDPTDIVNLYTNLDSLSHVIGHIQEYGVVILDRCRISTSGLNFNLGQIQTAQTIGANRFFAGFPTDQHLQNGIPYFNTFKFSIEGIDEWVWIRGINVINAMYRHEGGTRIISVKPPESISFNLTNGMQLEITFEMKGVDPPSPWKVGITQKAYFRLISEDAQEFNEFLSVAYKIVDLLCFTINEKVYLDSMSATSNEINQIIGDGITRPAKIDIYDPDLFYYSKDQPRIDRNQMLFTFSDIRDNAERMINRWIESYEDYKDAFDLYFLAQLKPQPSLEVKFLTLAQGLEVYHRRISSDDAPVEMGEVKLKYKELVQGLIEQYPGGEDRKWLEGKLEHLNDVTLGKRIKELINPFKEILGNSKERGKLAYKITVTRNYLTHRDPDLEPEAAKGRDLLVLCLKMELLFELHFLKLTGFTPGRIKSIADNCPKLLRKREG